MKGTCLCGAVRYKVTGTPTAFDLCHCSRCREASGSAFIAELVAPSPVIGYDKASHIAH
jgi:hypothetical protein